MTNYCGNCAFCDLKNKRSYYDEYYCKEKRKYVSLTDKACKDLILDPNKGNSYKSTFKPWGFYIVTIVNKILGMNENSEFLRTMSQAGLELRLSNNPLYQVLIEDYDITGVEIAKKIDKMPNKIDFAAYLYDSTLEPIMNKVKNGYLIEALVDYVNMVNTLKNNFNVEGLIETNYIAAILYQNDMLARTIFDVLGEDKLKELAPLRNIIVEANEEDNEIGYLYNYLGVVLTDLSYAYSDSTERRNITQKYFNTYIKLLIKDIDFGLTTDELKQSLNNVIFCIQTEATFIDKVINKESKENYSRTLNLGYNPLVKSSR